MAGLLPSVLRAQSVADRSALAMLDASLQQISTTTSLDHFQSQTVRSRTADGLGRTMVLLRRGELRGSRDDIEKAVSAATITTHWHDDWPWTWYILARGLAALELRGWEPLRPSESVIQGENYAQAAWRNLRMALDRDHDFPAARRWLVAQLVLGGDRLLLPDQLAPLEREVQRAAPDPDALLVWGRHLRTMRQYDSALAVFTRAAAVGSDRSRLALERARTLRALHDTGGAAAAYWEGLNQLTPAGRELYRFDLAWIIDADSLASFDRTPDSAVVPWMRKFWEERDANAVREPGSRLDEHLRRWALVYARYRVRSPWRRTMYDRIDLFFDNDDCLHMDLAFYQLMWKLPPTHEGDLRVKEWLLDQRGILYLRHGEPIQHIAGRGARLSSEDFESGMPAYTPDTSSIWSSWAKGGGAAMLNSGAARSMDPSARDWVPKQVAPHITESWLYLIEGNLRLLHFRDSYAIGMYDATTLSGFLPYSVGTWLARSGTLPEYHATGERIVSEQRFQRRLSHLPPGLSNAPGCWKEVQTADARSRSDATSAARNDSDSPPLVHPWQSVIQMFALGEDRDRSGKALVTFALGGDSLHATTTADGRALYQIHFRASAWNGLTGQTVSLDTTRRFVRSRPLAATERLVALLEIPLPAGRWELGVRAKQESDSSGAYALRRDVEIGTGTTLSLSDVVTGLPGSPPWKATDGADFPVNTSRDWPTGAPAELYFEVHGVPANASYRTTIAVRPRQAKGGQTIEVTSTDRSSGPVNYVRRSLSLEHLVAGEYELSVTVAAGSRRVVRTWTLLLLPTP